MLYGFVGAFAAVALAFLAASAASFVALRDVETAAHDLLGNALPSVMELMHARTAQRRLDVDAAILSTTRDTRPELIDEVSAARQELDRAIDAAMATPDYPGERELYERDGKPALAQLDQCIEELRAAILQDPGNDPRIVASVSRLNLAAKEVDDVLQGLAELNHSKAFDAASRIVSSHEHAVRMAFWLEGASSILAIGAAAVAVRAGRRFGREARRQLELERDRASELDAVAQRVAHDLMSPLATVSLSLHRVRQAHPDPDTVRAVDRSVRALERSREMAQGIYAFSRSGARPERDAAGALRAAALEAADALLESEAQPGLTVDVQPFDDVDVAMDQAVLGVVLSNLLSNAAKFSRDSAVRKVSVRADTSDDFVHVEVEDTGPGVPSGLEHTIFEPYRRAPGVTQPGLGLGLATVKRLVLAHGGCLGVRRARSGGAIFWFDLPRAQAAHAQEAREQPSQRGTAEARPVH